MRSTAFDNRRVVKQMARYKVIFDGEEQDEVFDSYDEAVEFAMQQLSDWHAGGEVLELSNPGDYPYDPDDEPEYEIVRA